jgi:hypothetical protein
LGYFVSKEDAVIACSRHRLRLHGDFAFDGARPAVRSKPTRS